MLISLPTVLKSPFHIDGYIFRFNVIIIFVFTLVGCTKTHRPVISFTADSSIYQKNRKGIIVINEIPVVTRVSEYGYSDFVLNAHFVTLPVAFKPPDKQSVADFTTGLFPDESATVIKSDLQFSSCWKLSALTLNKSRESVQYIAGFFKVHSACLLIFESQTKEALDNNQVREILRSVVVEEN